MNPPCEITVIHNYVEDYTAVPAPGWKFDRWQNCPDPEASVCRVDVPPALLRAVWGMETDLALEAHFYPLGSYSGVNATYGTFSLTIYDSQNRHVGITAHCETISITSTECSRW